MTERAPTTAPLPAPQEPAQAPPPDPSTRSPFDTTATTLATPTARPVRHHPNLFRPLLLAVIVGTAFAAGTADAPLRSIGWAIALAMLVIALIATSARRPASVVLGFAALAFIPWLVVRSSPWLTTVNLLAASALLLAALGLPAAASLAVSTRHHGLRVLRSLGGIPFGPWHVVHATHHGARRVTTRTIQRWAPSALAGIGALFAGLLLLASGDALLASFLDVDKALDVVGSRVVAAVCGATLFSLLTGAVHVPGSSDSAPSSFSLPAMPSLFAISGLAVAIGAYSATQVSAALLGDDFVTSRTGLTYAEYARDGFFQMVIVTAVSTCAVTSARGVARRHSDMALRLRIAAAALTAGVMVTVASAVIKLAVYAETFGLTMLRVYTVTFACWLGLVALLALVALLRRSATWFAPVLLVSAVSGAFAMNIANPERIVVEHNLDRADTTGKLDVAYLSLLSLDAAPAIFERLDDIDAVFEDSTRDGIINLDAATELRRVWCARVRTDETQQGDNDGGLSFNLARSNAFEAGKQACN